MEKRGRKLNPKSKVVLDQLYIFIEDVGEATANEICIELFGSISMKLMAKTRNYIMWLRLKLRKEKNIYFYAVDHKYQFLDEKTYISCLVENKNRWEGTTKAIQNMMKQGLEDHPQIKQNIVQLLGEMNYTLLQGNVKTNNVLPNPKKNDNNK